MSEQTDNDEVGDSQLGRYEYWEHIYKEELANHRELGDEGEIWFGAGVLETMLDWTDSMLQSRSSDSKDLSILDIGTGNGSFLFGLAERGYSRLTGSDYSAASIELCISIAAKRKQAGITWVHDDLLDSRLTGRYNVITDKGTLDAVGLSADAANKRTRYRQAAWELLKSEGVLVITSCNSTADELQEEFCHTQDGHFFSFIDKVKSYPVFRFGGVEGTKVCTLAFQKQG